MTFTNVLTADLHEGTVDGIAIKWNHSAKARLTTNAIDYEVDATAMKAATEHFTHKCSKHLGKTTAIIIGSFHKFTTVTRSGKKKAVHSHETLPLNPGGVKVHVNVTLPDGGLVQNAQWRGEYAELSDRDTPSPVLN
ncbi:hypothetical protein BO85DRAFT_497069 [Aspergillus piperis CBS 112811]|uniref:Uncharacterized protein n=1 Tax=Aspergillus piperis CBS 112811 TaxID=1448313 RepID=A0A8G1QXR7_9EURO|nr:hypothetical protein BO85DRAFT_497069 [Aspergillus piperis CBS 112811]RAH56351.1 hypothetical protein BO85DRAFT_497069 [Aspergillus piperis CBS 112811]